MIYQKKKICISIQKSMCTCQNIQQWIELDYFWSSLLQEQPWNISPNHYFVNHPHCIPYLPNRSSNRIQTNRCKSIISLALFFIPTATATSQGIPYFPNCFVRFSALLYLLRWTGILRKARCLVPSNHRYICGLQIYSRPQMGQLNKTQPRREWHHSPRFFRDSCIFV